MSDKVKLLFVLHQFEHFIEFAPECLFAALVQGLFQSFPHIRVVRPSYAYHCCLFMPSTYEHFVPEYADFGDLSEDVYFPGEIDLSQFGNQTMPSVIWSNPGMYFIFMIRSRFSTTLEPRNRIKGASHLSGSEPHCRNEIS